MHKPETEAFARLPQRHLSETEKQYIMLKIEKLRLNRERAQLVLDKGILLFFAFLAFALIAVQNSLIPRILFNILIICAVCILILAVTPYIKISKSDEKEVDKLLKELTGG